MSSLDSTSAEFLNKEDILEIIKINKDYSAITFSETTGIVLIDLSENSAAGKTFSNINIFQMKNNRFLVTADVNSIYSAAQIKDKIQKAKNKSTPQQILKYYKIREKDYFFHQPSGSVEPILVFRSQKLITEYQSKIKIDCPNYVIISES